MKPDTDGIELAFQMESLALLVPFAALRRPHLSPDKVHIYFIFRQRTLPSVCHPRTGYFPGWASPLHSLYEAVGYIVPVLSLGKHGHGAFYNNSYPISAP